MKKLLGPLLVICAVVALHAVPASAGSTTPPPNGPSTPAPRTSGTGVPAAVPWDQVGAGWTLASVGPRPAQPRRLRHGTRAHPGAGLARGRAARAVPVAGRAEAGLVRRRLLPRRRRPGPARGAAGRPHRAAHPAGHRARPGDRGPSFAPPPRQRRRHRPAPRRRRRARPDGAGQRPLAHLGRRPVGGGPRRGRGAPRHARRDRPGRRQPRPAARHPARRVAGAHRRDPGRLSSAALVRRRRRAGVLLLAPGHPPDGRRARRHDHPGRGPAPDHEPRLPRPELGRHRGARRRRPDDLPGQRPVRRLLPHPRAGRRHGADGPRPGQHRRRHPARRGRQPTADRPHRHLRRRAAACRAVAVRPGDQGRGRARRPRPASRPGGQVRTWDEPRPWGF